MGMITAEVAAITVVAVAATMVGMTTVGAAAEMMTMITETKSKLALFLSYPKDNPIFIPVNLF